MTEEASLTTDGIRVSVVPTYQAAYSRPAQHRFVFSYHVTIQNQRAEPVQLLRRHWIIWDGNGHIREVEGEGVVGKQPIIPPGGKHEYASWCPIKSGIGKMHGMFLMVDKQQGGDPFQVAIPEFRLIAPLRLN
ncbi:MAG TPA: Co2+/Mg2+ efflux protein ApaG [Phaeodactylibacter sp.]|nr:Co2+/Mg2+ efflux protein ApaG [Phaeodactylibacter sp.]